MLISIALISDPHGGSSIDEKKKRNCEKKQHFCVDFTFYLCLWVKTLVRRNKSFYTLVENLFICFYPFQKGNTSALPKKIKMTPSKTKNEKEKKYKSYAFTLKLR